MGERFVAAPGADTTAVAGEFCRLRPLHARSPPRRGKRAEGGRVNAIKEGRGGSIGLLREGPQSFQQGRKMHGFTTRDEAL